MNTFLSKWLKLQRVTKETIRLEKDWSYRDRYKSHNELITQSDADKVRVVFIGDSITEGWVGSNPDFFSSNGFVGRGISGQTSPQLLVRFREDVIALQPQAVVIHIGTNDIGENTGPFEHHFTLGNIISMAELAQIHHIKVILASVLPASHIFWNAAALHVPEKIHRLNTALKNYAQKHHHAWLDYHTSMKNAAQGLDPELAFDGIHPTRDGYQIMEKIALKVIKQVLRDRE